MATTRKSKRGESLSALGHPLQQRLDQLEAVYQRQPELPARGIMECAWRARAQAALLAEYTAKRHDVAHCYKDGDTAAIVAASAEILAELTEETVAIILADTSRGI